MSLFVDVVYLVKDLGKHSARERYLVGRVEAPWCYIRKLTDGGQLRDAFYKVKLRDVLKVPAAQPVVPVRTGNDDSDGEFSLEGVGDVAGPERDTEEYEQAGAVAGAESEEASVAPLPAVPEVLLQDDDVEAPAGGKAALEEDPGAVPPRRGRRMCLGRRDDFVYSK